MFVLELTVGFENNIDFNTKRKAIKYQVMLKPLENKFEKVNLINLSMGALERVGVHSNVINMLKALGFQQHEVAYLINLLYKKSVLCILYEVRNKAWNQPSLLSW